MNMASEVVSLKLLIDTKSRKALFAEAGKEFVDFLFSLLSLPVGTVIKLLSKKSMVGSIIGNLYQSIESLSDTYIQPNLNKESVLNPKTLTSSVDVPLLLGPSSDNMGSMKFYQCPTHVDEVTDNPRAKCPKCTTLMTHEVKYFPFRSSRGEKRKAPSDDGEGGIVKGIVTYMVMDDLVVSPMCTISSITMLNKFNVKEVGALEGLQLLKASLQTKAVLTSVFLGA